MLTAESLSKFLRRIPKRLYWTLIFPFLAAIIVLQYLSFTPIQEFIDRKLFHPLLFTFREYFAPQSLDPRIKIFALDDRTVASLKSFDIPLEDWGLVISHLAKKKGVHIFIDKLFDKKYSQDEVNGFKRIVGSASRDVTIISFATKVRIPFRNAISRETLLGNENTFFKDRQNFPQLTTKEDGHYIYGAGDNLISGFGSFGFANYSGSNFARAYIWSLDGALVPHAALFNAGNLSFKENELLVNQKKVNAKTDGRFLINFASASIYKMRTYSFLAVIDRAKKNLDITVISPGDFVFILPAMYTGNTDFSETPFGTMPGGYSSVAILNSALNGTWLKTLDDPGFFVCIAGFLGFVISASLSPPLAFLLMFLTILILAIVSLSIFTIFGVVISIILPCVVLCFGVVLGTVLSSTIVAIEDQRMKRELDVARTVQKTFFSEHSSDILNLVKVDGVFLPASECGGDWWTSFVDGDFYYVMIGDALGHGVPAALMTATIYSGVKIIEDELRSGGKHILPSEILTKLNKVVFGMQSVYITFQVFRINKITLECVFANAGHCPPIIIPLYQDDKRLPKGRRGKMITHPGNVLGSDVESKFIDHNIAVARGDRILLYSDGLIENEASSKTAVSGKLWLSGLINLVDQEIGGAFKDLILSEYSKRIGLISPNDDVTIVVVDISQDDSNQDPDVIRKLDISTTVTT